MKKIIENIKKSPLWGLPVYIVGGAVRDYLRGEAPKDVDLLVEASPEELKRRGGQPVSTVSAFPVYLFEIDGLGTVEVALPRKERKVGLGYRGFEAVTGPNITVADDLARRDFTVNAMAIRVEDGALIDPYGGVSDLQKGVLRHVSHAFVEDPLRVFRAYRFCGKGFSLAEETREFIRSHPWGEDLKALPAERVFAEMVKAMASPFPHRFFEEMVKTGIGEEFFPEVFAMAKIPAGPEIHHEGDCLTHSLLVLRKVAEKTTDPVVRLAAFLHDLGKVETPAEKWPHHHGHDKAGEEVVKRCLVRLKAPRKVVALCSAVAGLHMEAGRWAELRAETRLEIAQKALQAGAEIALPLVVEADQGVKLSDFCETASVSQLSASELGIAREWMKKAAPEAIQQRVLQEKIKILDRRR